jgi:hypothetical protein
MCGINCFLADSGIYIFTVCDIVSDTFNWNYCIFELRLSRTQDVYYFLQCCLLLCSACCDFLKVENLADDDFLTVTLTIIIITNTFVKCFSPTSKAFLKNVAVLHYGV